jgi:hypothetical protein
VDSDHTEGDAPSNNGDSVLSIDCLSTELLMIIFGLVDSRMLASVLPTVCQRWREVCCEVRPTCLDLSDIGGWSGIASRQALYWGTSQTVVTFVNRAVSLSAIDLTGFVDLRHETLVAVLAQCPQLSTLGTLRLGWCVGLKFWKWTIRGLSKHCSGLTTIDLHTCVLVDDHVVVMIAEACPQLQEIDVFHCGRLTDHSLGALALNCHRLSSVNFGLADISDVGVVELALACPHLRSVAFGRCCQLTDTAVWMLAECCRRLSSVDFSYCAQLTDSAVAHLAERCKYLAIVLLGECPKLSDDSIVALAEHCGKHLECLNVKKCRTSDPFPTQFTDHSVIVLARHCSGLRSLNLDGANASLTARSGRALAQHCPRLVSVRGISWREEWALDSKTGSS